MLPLLLGGDDFLSSILSLSLEPLNIDLNFVMLRDSFAVLAF